MAKLGEQLSVFAFAAIAIGVIVAVAFAAGYVIGKVLL